MIKYNFKLIGGSVLLLASLFFVSCQKDNNSNPKKAVDRSKLSDSDRKNVEIIQGLLEDESFFSEVATIGTERSSKPELKEFSSNAKESHLKNLEKIKVICVEKGIQIPEKLPKELNDELYKLTVSNNADFDNYYYQSLLKDYKTKLDSLAKYINEETFVNSQDILIEISSVYNKNIDQLDKIK